MSNKIKVEECKFEYTDTEMLDWYNKNSDLILSYCNKWYWRTSYGQPHQRANSLREAISLAIKNTS